MKSDIPAFLRRQRRKRAAAARLDDTTQAYQPLIGTWLIEIALMQGWHQARPILGDVPAIFEDADFLRVCGLQPVETEERREGASRRKPAYYERLLRDQLQVLDEQSVAPDLPLFANLDLLGELLALSEGEKLLLAFAVVVDAFPAFHAAISPFTNSSTSTEELCQVLARLSGLPLKQIEAATQEEAPLLASGLVRLDRELCDLEDKLDLIDGLGGIMLSRHGNADELVARFVRRAEKPALTVADFPHLEADTRLLTDYLTQAAKTGSPGTNVLLYGPPGVGKTQLAQSLAAAVGADLYEIGFSDVHGDPIKGEQRLRAYNFCQRLLARRDNAMLMFDEIEDVFESDDAFFALFGGPEPGRCTTAGKAWVNRALERNAVPALWISNEVGHIDPAYLRRFDYSVQCPIPPRSVRLNIVRRHFDPFDPPEAWLNAIADNDRTSPAQLEQAAKVARLAAGGDPERALDIAAQALERSAELLGQKVAPIRTRRRTEYDLRFINASTDIERLVAGLRRTPSATLCFYGPAGTGKSELARYLADEIDRPLLVRRASDILSMWVGGTEKNIAEMFDEARREDAVLVLDEADSFLADRRGANNSWEATQVNELLTQMEAFEGVFVCTTNLMEKLDPASLRRFALKVEFHYLKPEQSWEMFRREYARLSDGADDASAEEAVIRAITKLTPGDFAAVARQCRLLPAPPSAAEFRAMLQKECEVKGGSLRSIGFM